MVRTVLFLPDYGNSNPYQRQLGRALANRGHSVSIASGSGWFPLLAAYRSHGKPAVVHLHWLHPYITGRGPLTSALKGLRFLLELSVLRIIGTTLVWTVHNLYEHERRAPRVENRVKRAVLHLASAGIVHCESAKQATIDAFQLTRRQRRKLTVIPHGHYARWYPGNSSRAAARDRLGIDEASTVFLFFGRIQPYKNVPGLIEAFRSIPDDQARLLVVGEPRDTSLADAIAVAGRDDPRIRFVFEYVPDEAVQQYFAAADAVVLPYRDVLTSGSAVLAASFGRAVIAPRVGCIADRFDRGAGLIYDFEVDGLDRALARALHLDLDSIGRQHHAEITDPDWPEIADSTASAYESRQRQHPPTAR